MPTWKKYKLGEVISVLTDYHANGSYKILKKNVTLLEEQNYAVMIRTKNFEQNNFTDNLKYCNEHSYNFLKKSKVYPGDILMNKIANAGAVYYMPDLGKPVSLAMNLFLIRVNKDIANQRFIFYYLRNAENYIRQFAAGTAAKTITKEAVRNLDLELPEKNYQNWIVDILSSFDHKIELNLQMNKTLEEMAMALYKHWFVDFGPFKDGEFVDSELGPIPKGWEVKRLGDLMKIKHGFAFTSNYFTTEPNESLLLTPGNFEPNGGIKFNWQKQKFYLGKFPDEYILKKGDLIIAMTDLTQDCRILGSPAIIPDEDFKYLHNQRLGLVNINNETLNNSILYRFFNTINYRSQVIGGKTGTTVSHTAPDRIYRIPFAIPMNGSLIELSNQLQAFDEMIFNNLIENKNLISTRDYMLPKLISGEVSV